MSVGIEISPKILRAELIKIEPNVCATKLNVIGGPGAAKAGVGNRGEKRIILSHPKLRHSQMVALRFPLPPFSSVTLTATEGLPADKKRWF